MNTRTRNRMKMVPQSVYLFFVNFFLIEPNNFWATVNWLSKIGGIDTDITHSCDIFHEFFVILFDSLSCLMGHSFGLIHLPLCLQKRVDASFLLFLEDVVTQLMFLLFVSRFFFLRNFLFIGSEFILIKIDLSNRD
jgi:hypothetical protein